MLIALNHAEHFFPIFLSCPPIVIFEYLTFYFKTFIAFIHAHIAQHNYLLYSYLLITIAYSLYLCKSYFCVDHILVSPFYYNYLFGFDICIALIQSVRILLSCSPYLFINVHTTSSLYLNNDFVTVYYISLFINTLLIIINT